MSKQYQFTNNWSGATGKVDPAAVVRECNAIGKQFGHVEPQIMVNRAKPKSAELHEAFEWDDQKAANIQRCDVARRMIRAVEIVDEGQPQGPAFIHVAKVAAAEQEEGDYGYLPAKRVASDQQLMKIAREGLQMRLKQAMKAVREFDKQLAEWGYEGGKNLQDVDYHVTEADKSLAGVKPKPKNKGGKKKTARRSAKAGGKKSKSGLRLVA